MSSSSSSWSWSPSSSSSSLLMRLDWGSQQEKNDIPSCLMVTSLQPSWDSEPPTVDSQVKSFLGYGGLSRNRLVRLINLKAKLARRTSVRTGHGQSQLEICLYELERLAHEANSSLAAALAEVGRMQVSCMPLLDTPREFNFSGTLNLTLEDEQPMGSREGSAVSNGRSLKRTPASRDSGVFLGANELEEMEQRIRKAAALRRRQRCKCRARFSQTKSALWQQIRLRSNRQIDSIVGFSCRLFAQLLKSSPLLRLDLSAISAPAKLQQLKMFACVECQKMRAVLRHEWLPRCLHLAFDFLQESRASSASLAEAKGQSGLPSVLRGHLDSPDQFEQRYFTHLAALMATLLRRHFLVEAFNLWLGAVSGTTDRRASGEPNQFEACKLSLAIELVDGGDSRGFTAGAVGAECAEPRESVQEALCFVCAELATICARLPRVESELAHLETERQGNRWLSVLSPGDDLLAETGARLAELVAACWPPADQGDCVPLCAASYSHIIRVVNSFRQSSGESLNEILELDWPPIRDDDGDERMAQLRTTCREIEVLDLLDERLSVRLERFSHCGRLVQLDCEPMRRSLRTALERERSLLVRIKVDELTRLMDQLRLQFDELELNIDLEVAVEDYLNERWQAKQSQQPSKLEQELLFDAADPEPLFEADSGHAGALDQNRVESGDLPGANVGATGSEPPHLEAPGTEGARKETQEKNGEEEEEELVNALASNNNLNVAHLFALSQTGSASTAKNSRPIGELEEQIGLRVAPLIECRLLVQKFKCLNEFATNEFPKLNQDMRLVFSSLVFFSEHSVARQRFESLKANYDDDSEANRHRNEAIHDLARRANEFRWLIEESLERLRLSRDRLFRSNLERSRVLSQATVEFDWLMSALSRKRLAEMEADEEPASSGGAGKPASAGLRQLDVIQETSGWAQKLDMRLGFLECQNDLMQKELVLLFDGAKFEPEPSESCLDERHGRAERAHEFQLRAELLQKWARLSPQQARFWRLAEHFETQQVKWLNSNSHRLDYAHLEAQFRGDFLDNLDSISRELKQIEANQAPSGVEFVSVLQMNVKELANRLEHFRKHRLPAFKFITSKHLTHEHWLELARLLLADGDHSGNERARRQLNPDTCTTVAQLLELEQEFGQPKLTGDKFIQHLSELTHRAAMEHELAALLLAEGSRARPRGAGSSRTSFRLHAWSERELVLAASRFIEAKLLAAPACAQHSLVRGQGERTEWARRLVGCYSKVVRLSDLGSTLDLGLEGAPTSEPMGGRQRALEAGVILVKQAPKLSSKHRLGPEERSSMFVEFLRLFCEWLIEDHEQLSGRLREVRAQLDKIGAHFQEIDQILASLEQLKQEERFESQAGECKLSQLERDKLRLEMEREILATREALSLEEQRAATSKRDECVRQISERAVPALRAASRALDCIGDGRSLRSLRAIRPRPPLALQLVIEPVCLLRNSVCEAGASSARFGMSPVRTFDALSGRMLDDYWPVAWRTLNGLHTSQLLRDLRERVNGHRVESKTMQIIRRRYLARKEFSVKTIANINRDCASLARWLQAVDVFNRVLEVVRPSYAAYQQAERKLAGLLEELAMRRQQIEQLGARLELTDAAISEQIGRRNSLADLLIDCSRQSAHLEASRLELREKEGRLLRELQVCERKSSRSLCSCALRAARFIFIGSPSANKIANQMGAIERLITAELSLGPT